MLTYPARFEADGDAFIISFPDIPEALTQAESLTEARLMAADALLTALDFYFEDRRIVPMPSAIGADMVGIDLPASTAAKVLLLNTMLEQQITPAALARRLHTSPQSVSRLVDLRHASKIDTIADALQALGRKLVLTVH